nr:MAG TPA: hypothetical protein [Caudoviricetes sp.]
MIFSDHAGPCVLHGLFCIYARIRKVNRLTVQYQTILSAMFSVLPYFQQQE